MRKFNLICFLLLSAVALAQPKLSPYTIRALQQEKMTESVSMKTVSSQLDYVGALVKITNAAQAEQYAKKIGAHVGTKAGDVWTLRIPVNQLQTLSAFNGVSYVQIDEPVIRPQMQQVRVQTRTDSVVNGWAFGRPYTGKGIVMGVIDFGFDYNHPANFDTTNTHLRLVKVWEQGGVGTPPAGYTYGRELADTTAIRAATTDNIKQTHGTNVAGIAAGSGVGSALQGRQHRGIAYDAEMVFVCVRRDSIEQQWKQGSFTDFVDGVAYIFNYAQSVNKPCVINISWGSHSGPHNGTTLLNQALDNLSGPGRIIVLSAGNDGREQIHLSKTFTAIDTAVSTFLSFSSEAYKRTWVDVWGEAGKSFCLKTALYRNDSIIAESPLRCTNNQQFVHHMINDAGDTCSIDFVSISAESNGQPRITADIFNRSTDTVLVTITGVDGTIHTWNEYYYYGYDKGFRSEYVSYNKSFATDGNNETTVNDMGSGKEMILVGAYTARTGFMNVDNNFLNFNGETVGQITGFSSRGPYTDGRIKPDIAAPGLTLASPVSSFDTRYQVGGPSRLLVVNNFINPRDNKRYNYSEFTGTSASSPVVSGIVALMLEANNWMFPFHVRNAIKQSAITDNFTGVIPAQGNNIWGHGKINATGAVAGAIAVIGLPSVNTNQQMPISIYPNPIGIQGGNFNVLIHAPVADETSIYIHDPTGKLIMTERRQLLQGINELQIQLPELTAGLYSVQVRSASHSGFAKLIVTNAK
jgi:minor extracellular serine protease Vpr